MAGELGPPAVLNLAAVLNFPARWRQKVGFAMRDVHATRQELAATRHELAELRDEVRALQAATSSELTAHMSALRNAVAMLDGASSSDRPAIPVEPILGELQRTLDAIQVVYDQEPDNRRLLHALRQTDEYRLAFTDDEPLISVLIPTYRAFTMLRDRAIPSVLAQTYENWEIVVVGDAAPPETEAVISGFDDPRIRYHNLPMRGPYPEDDYDAWLVTAVPPFNAALRFAKGRWIAPFADDDQLRPDALAHVLAKARAHEYEFCYAKILLHARDGSQEEIGAFPPGIGKSGTSAPLQGGLFHAGLRFFEQELADAIFRTPSDWSLVRRMLRAGVRVGFLDEVTCDYFPSYRGEDAPGAHPLR